MITYFYEEEEEEDTSTTIADKQYQIYTEELEWKANNLTINK